MIDIKTKQHDKFSLEFKVGFITRRKLRKNDFKMAMWIFVPRGLDINPSTYSKSNFYQDLKSNIRLITPKFLLRDIPGEPVGILRKACEDAASNPTNTFFREYEYHIKMFAAIVKSAARDESANIIATKRREDIEFLCQDYVKNIKKVLEVFHSLRNIILAPSVTQEHLDTYRYADEFICNTLIRHLFTIKNKVKDAPEVLLEEIREIDAYRISMGYRRPDPQDTRASSLYLHRIGTLKKLVESQLFLRVPKKKDGVLVEQLYYSIAAGLAMLFATVVAWVFQSTFGNLTWPLFIALIISYMMKDRIKELMRYYFAHRLSNRHFDNTAKISIRDNEIGVLKEAMDFVSLDRVPSTVMEKRLSTFLTAAERRVCDDTVILYRKNINIDRDKMEEGSLYNLPGINDIIRLQVDSFTHKMDNPVIEQSCLDAEGNETLLVCTRNYFLNIVLQYTFDGATEFKHFRVSFNRDGISQIEEIS